MSIAITKIPDPVCHLPLSEPMFFLFVNIMSGSYNQGSSCTAALFIILRLLKTEIAELKESPVTLWLP